MGESNPHPFEDDNGLLFRFHSYTTALIEFVSFGWSVLLHPSNMTIDPSFGQFGLGGNCCNRHRTIFSNVGSNLIRFFVPFFTVSLLPIWIVFCSVSRTLLCFRRLSLFLALNCLNFLSLGFLAL